MLDGTTTLNYLKQELRAFRDDRDWQQFHTPPNLAQSIAIEAGELLELYQWGKTPAPDVMADELADVVIYCLNMAIAADIDLAIAIKHKMEQNGEKYPIELARGKA